MSAAAVEQRRHFVTDEHRERFLAGLRDALTVSGASEVVGVARQRFYELRAADEGFAQAWADAWETGTDLLEDELKRRAMGYDETTFDGEGRVLRRVHRYDTVAMVALLKARRPELYRDNGSPSGPVTIVLQSAFGGVPEIVEGEAIEVAEIEEAPS